MDHPSPASFPDPMQRIGTPVTPPHGTRPNPAYQDLLTLYAKVYGAEERLATALEPACQTVRNGEAWIGRAARGWTTELEDWNRRLGRAAGWILQELADRLRSTSPYVPITEPLEPGGAQPTPLQPTPVTAGFQPAPNPGGRFHPSPNPGGGLHPGPNPGGGLQTGPDPGGLQPGPNPGGRFHPGPNPGGGLQTGPDPGGQLHADPPPGGPLRHGPDPGGPAGHPS
jgi:hypothetical protein